MRSAPQSRARDRSIPISIVSRIGEQADPATQGFELRNQRRERGDVVVEIETVIGGELVVAIGYQCGLRRAHGFAQGDEARIASPRRCERIAFEVVLDTIVGAKSGEGMDVGFADMAGIGTRMHGDALCAGIEAGTRRTHDVGFATAARIAQHGDLVDIDAQRGHACRIRKTIAGR